NFSHYLLRFIIIDFASSSDQTRLFWGLTDNKPGINCNTVPAYTWPWLKNIDTRMTVGEPDQLPYIDIQLVANNGQLVGEGNVDVPKAVLRQFAHFSRACIGNDALPLHKRLIECRRLVRAL